MVGKKTAWPGSIFIKDWYFPHLNFLRVKGIKFQFGNTKIHLYNQIHFCLSKNNTDLASSKNWCRKKEYYKIAYPYSSNPCLCLFSVSAISIRPWGNRFLVLVLCWRKLTQLELVLTAAATAASAAELGGGVICVVKLNRSHYFTKLILVWHKAINMGYQVRIKHHKT